MQSEGLTQFLNVYFTTGVRWVFVGLAVLILLHQLVSLLKMRNPSEIWAYLLCPDGTNVPLTHWENLIGRSRGCDIIINLGSVSRSHATLIRDSNGVWRYHDLNSRNGSYINGVRVYEPTVLKGGDQLTIGGENFELYPVSLKERLANVEKRKRRTHPVSPWPSLVMITIFQLLTVMQLKISLGDDFSGQTIPAFALLCVLMWAYTFIMRGFHRNGFEMEVIAFFLSTLCLAVTASYGYTADGIMKQAICIALGIILFFFLCWYLRDLTRTKRMTYFLLGVSALLLIINLLFGTVTNGAQNWISIGGLTFQPSELVKIVFIYVGAATLDELQEQRSLYQFMGFSIFCLGCLALMGDFGTAMIFFVTFLVISFLRSGDFTKLFLVLGAAGLMGLMVLRFRPYVASRFSTWGHAWDYATEGGFQQVQTMSAISSGGLPGLGAGDGNLGDLFGAGTDLVFGMLGEEWGLIIAILAVLCIITLCVFAFRSIAAGRSTYYSIAACSTASLFVFQTTLNVLGSVDILPLTGVTFPFLSTGGTSMISSWGLLAFLKAADTRQNASFAIRLDRKSEFKDQLSEGDFQDPEDIFEEIDGADLPDSADLLAQMENDEEFQRYWEARRRQEQEAMGLRPEGGTNEIKHYHFEKHFEPAPKRPSERTPQPETAQEALSALTPETRAQEIEAEQKQAEQIRPVEIRPYDPQAEEMEEIMAEESLPEDSMPDGLDLENMDPYSPAADVSAEEDPLTDAARTEEPKPERPAPKPRPRPVSYRNVDDDAFFRSLEEKQGPAFDPDSMFSDSEEQPLTLEDIFDELRKN